MNQKKLILFISLVIIITAFFGFLAYLTILKREGKETKVSVERMLYQIYTGNIDRDVFVKTLKDLNTSKDPLDIAIKSLVIGFVSNDFKEFENFIQSQGKPLKDLDLQLCYDIYKAKNKILTETNYYIGSFSDIKYKVNVYEYYKLAGIDFLGICKTNDIAYKEWKDLGMYFHDKDFLEFAKDILGQMKETSEFVDPEAMAFYGSTITKFAIYVENPVNKVEFVREGCKYIDKAVMDFPDYFTPRIVRILNYLSLPEFFRKYGFVSQDIEYLISVFENNGTFKVVEGYKKIREIKAKDVKDWLLVIAKKLEETKAFPRDKKQYYVKMLRSLEKKYQK